MKKISAIFLMVLASALVSPAGTTNVIAVINGKQVQPNSTLGTQVAQKSLELLASCAYVNPKPKWGAATEPKSMADAQKESHLHLLFSTPITVAVPTEKVTVQVHEMVISLPLATAGIWVRTEDRVEYFAMFNHSAYGELHKLLARMQSHENGA